MTEHKHTPGPWKIERQEYPADMDVSFEITVPREDGTERHICQTIMRDKSEEQGWIAEDEANALLIVTAPEMMEKLEAAVQALRSYQYGNASTELAESVADAGQAVLAKAKGA